MQLHNVMYEMDYIIIIIIMFWLVMKHFLSFVSIFFHFFFFEHFYSELYLLIDSNPAVSLFKFAFIKDILIPFRSFCFYAERVLFY